MDILTVRPAVTLILLTLVACGGSESSAPETVNTQAKNTPTKIPADSSGTSDLAIPPSVRYPQYPSAGNIEPPAITMTNPFGTDLSAAQTGEILFAAMNCDGCHGGGALGFVGPSLVDGRWRYGGEDGAVFQSIFYGRPRGMPAYGGLLNDTVVWEIVSYLRSQPEPSVVPTVVWTD